VHIKTTEDNLSGKAGNHLGRLAELSIGLSSFGLFGFLFSYLLYPSVIYAFGIFKGGGIMTILSFIVCLILLKVYDSTKRDWLGIEAVKSLKDYDGRSKLGRLWAWFFRKGDPVIFLFLTIRVDPFVTIVYLRRGNYTGLSRRDWTIFMGSLIIGNAYWTLACYMGITLLEWGWKRIVGL